MIVNQGLCKGCGACVEACPNEAIHLVEEKAFIDQVLCTSCELCVDVCPTGALQGAQMMIPQVIESPRAIEVLHPQAAIETSPKLSHARGAVFSLVGQYVLPRLLDVLVSVIERRLTSPVEGRVPMRINSSEGRPHRRQRQRRGRL